MDAKIEQLRLPWESRDQWGLRSAFLRRHWDSMPKPRLLARAQAFINIEFMGCQYAEDVMAEIAQMSDGMTDEYKRERKATVNKILGQDPKQKRKELRKAARERRDNALGTRKVNLNTAGDEGGQPAAKAAKHENEGADVKVEPMETKPTPVDTTAPHLAAMNRVRLQLTMTVRGASTCQQLAAAIGRSKIAGCSTFEFEWLDGVDDAPFHTAVLSINGLVVVAMIGDREALEESKERAAQVAVEKINRMFHEIRPLSIDGKSYESCLFTGVRKEVPANGPDDMLLHMYQTKITKLVTCVKAEFEIVEAKALNTLNNCSAKCDVELEWKSTQLQGWTSELSLLMSHVRASDPVVVKGGKSKEDEEKKKLAFEVLKKLRLANHRVVRTNDRRQLVMVATDDMVTLDLLHNSMK